MYRPKIFAHHVESVATVAKPWAVARENHGLATVATDDSTPLANVYYRPARKGATDGNQVMLDTNDVTLWIARLSDGDEAAVQVIWERYFERLVRLARRRMETAPRRVADEEDVALSAIQSFYQGARAGRFPRLNDRHDLWKLLVTITVRKVFAQIKRQRAAKRGGGAVRGESIFLRNDNPDEVNGLAQVLGEEPTPELACQVAETCGLMLGQLEDEELRQIALLKMEGYSNQEIAVELECVVRTVERKLARIRQKWERSGQDAD